MPSADFTIEGASAPPEYSGSYSQTIDLALVSTNGVRTVAWSIVGWSRSDAVVPTITPAGSPSGATASFNMGTNPGGTTGVSFLVQCLVNGGLDDAGQEDASLKKRAVVGVANSAGIVPIPFDEYLERDADIGWTGVFNEALNSAGGSSGGGGGGHGFPFTYSTTTTDADPGAGTFRANNATLSSATTLYVDLLEFNGTDVTDWLDQIDDYTGAIKGVIRLQSRDDETKWIEYTVTAWTTAVGYRKLTVSYKDGPGGLTTDAGDTFLSFDYATTGVPNGSTQGDLPIWNGSAYAAGQIITLASGLSTALAPADNTNTTAASGGGTAVRTIALTDNRIYVLTYLIVCKEQTDLTKRVFMGTVLAERDGSGAAVLVDSPTFATGTMSVTLAVAAASNDITFTITNNEGNTVDVQFHIDHNTFTTADP